MKRIEFINAEKNIRGAWNITYLIKGIYFRTYQAYNYTKAEALKLARREALAEADQMIFNQ